MGERKSEICGNTFLNSFQRAMLRWRQLAPYNAGHILQLKGAPDLSRWKEACRIECERLRLGVPSFKKNEVSFTKPESINFSVVDGSLEQKIEFELNRRFDEGEVPIRFFCLNDGHGGHFLGTTYDHWLADSYSIRAFMKCIFFAYKDSKREPSHLSLSSARPTGDFTWYRNAWGTGTGLWFGFRAFLRHRHCHRVSLAEPVDLTTGFLLFPLPLHLIDRLAVRSKELKVTVNDLFSTAAAQCLGNLTAHLRYQKSGSIFHRDQVGLGLISDIRGAFSNSLERVFGLILGWSTLVLDHPEKVSSVALLRQISRQTALSRDSGGKRASFYSMVGSNFWWEWFRTPRDKALLFQKHFPVCGGISNVNLSGSWIEKAHASPPGIIDYFRFSPTGPLLPIVFTLTTLGSKLSLGLSFRTTMIGRAEARQLGESFIRALEKLAGS